MLKTTRETTGNLRSASGAPGRAGRVSMTSSTSMPNAAGRELKAHALFKPIAWRSDLRSRHGDSRDGRGAPLPLGKAPRESPSALRSSKRPGCGRRGSASQPGGVQKEGTRL